MQGTSMAYTPMAKKVLAAVPGGEIYDIKYSSSAEYVMTPKQGASSGLQYIKGQIAKCPKTVFVLMGYSKGVSETSHHHIFQGILNYEANPGLIDRFLILRSSKGDGSDSDSSQ
jgi:hypothetical protein